MGINWIGSSAKVVLSLLLLQAALVTDIPAAMAQLNENCVVSILNRTARVQPDGTWVLPNVPANFGQVRARATCVEGGVTLSGQSDFFTIPANGSVDVPEIQIGIVDPIPESLNVSAPTTVLMVVGQSTQLTVEATFSDGATEDVTSASNGTNYTVTNPAVATVDDDGLVTAEMSGTVVISAMLEGALGLLQLQVVLAGDSDGDGIPDDLELANGLNPENPVDGLEDPDRDGLTTKEEVVDFGTDHQVADTDGDNISDGEEVVAGADGFITNPVIADTDGDGIRDGLEVATATDPTDPSSFDLAAALDRIEVTPSSFVLTFNTIAGEASRQLTVTGIMTDGATIDLTSTGTGTNYTSSDLGICNFGAPDGRVFAGADGSCTVTASNNGFSDSASILVRTFTPAALSFINIPGYANNVDVNDDIAYVAAGATGLQVVDVADPEFPEIIGSVDTPGNANDTKVMEHTAYVADGVSGLQIFDVAIPDNTNGSFEPSFIASVDTPGDAHDVAVSGDLVLIADGPAGLQIANVADATAPGIIGDVDTPGVAKGVSVSGDGSVAVVADGFSGIQIIDITDPSDPSIVGNAPTGDARDVVIRGDFAFVADFNSSLTVVDISDPANPTVRASTSLNTGGRLTDVALGGDFAFGSDVLFVNGVPIISVETPDNPVVRATLDFSTFRDDNGTGIAADSNFVYLTASRGITENGTAGDTRLYIGQYLALEDNAGIPPTVQITAPAEDDSLIEGSTVQISVDASDDVAVAAVDILVDGDLVFTDTAAPYEFSFVVPLGLEQLTIGAQAVDLGSNVGVAPDVTVNVIPDPGTIAVGRVVSREKVSAFDDDFEGAVGSEWTQTTTSTTPLGNRTFLGEFVNDTVSLVLTGLPAHEMVTVSFDLYIIQSWDGNNLDFGPDIWEANVTDGPTLIRTTFSMFGPQAFPDEFPDGSNSARSGAVENNTLGFTFDGLGSDSVYRMKFTIPHSGGSLQFNFLASGLEDFAGNESWGLDNVSVELTQANPVPGATVTCLDTSTETEPSGTFSITGLPTVQGNIRCTAAFVTAEGTTLRGTSQPVAPITGDVTDVGDIVLGFGRLIGSSSAGDTRRGAGQSTNPGSVFIIDTIAGTAELIGTPENTPNGLSDIAFDPVTRTLYAIHGAATRGAELLQLDPETAAVVTRVPITSILGSFFGSDALVFDDIGTLYVGAWSQGRLMIVDPLTGQALSDLLVSGGGTNNHLSDLAFDAVTGELWASRGGSLPGRIVRLDPLTASVTKILDLPGAPRVTAIAFDADGTLFASLQGNQLATVDTDTGDLAFIGTGFGGEKIAGLGFEK